MMRFFSLKYSNKNNVKFDFIAVIDEKYASIFYGHIRSEDTLNLMNESLHTLLKTLKDEDYVNHNFWRQKAIYKTKNGSAQWSIQKIQWFWQTFNKSEKRR